MEEYFVRSLAVSLVGFLCSAALGVPLDLWTSRCLSRRSLVSTVEAPGERKNTVMAGNMSWVKVMGAYRGDSGLLSLRRRLPGKHQALLSFLILTLMKG